MEKRLTLFPALGMDGPEGDVAPVKIGMINFAFDNAEIIYGLKKRGQAIMNEEWRELAIVNDNLTKRLNNNQDLMDKLQTPVVCFLTLE